MTFTLNQYLAQRDAEQAAHETVLADLDANVPGWEEREIETLAPERFVSEADMEAPTAMELADLDAILDWEAFGGFHNP